MKNNANIAAFILSVIGIIIVINTALQQFFNIGVEQKVLTIFYCVTFILLTIKYKNLLNKKYVTMPLYVMVLQMVYSFFLMYI